MRITLINPNLVVQQNDPLTTGIVYMPVTLASFAASLMATGLDVSVVDTFGLAPRHGRCQGKFLLLGLDPQQMLRQIPADTQLIFIFANQVINHVSVVQCIEAIKGVRQPWPLGILENAQAVTAYALGPVAEELFHHGADLAVTGDPEVGGIAVAQWLQAGHGLPDLPPMAGVLTPSHRGSGRNSPPDLDSLPFPAWELFPLANYWSLRFAHGPQSRQRYLPMQTSRGCPYPCRFCVAPATTGRRWRPRSAQRVVEEMVFLQHRFGVDEFHIEDLNPTMSDQRIRDICVEIIEKKLNISWKIAAGTKVESIKDETTVGLMAAAGCRYVSISPESGAEEMLKAMHKPFKLNHAMKIIGHMKAHGIRSQACFVLGFPGETSDHRRQTRDLVHTLTRAGVDEIALFMITPTPGSELFQEAEGFDSLSDLNFTPTWRPDYAELNHFRKRLYLSFLLWKFRYHPFAILRQTFNFFVRRRFETKMEMVPYRAMVWKWVGRKCRPEA
ncbi:MAG: B12-binding domain-containing radical SAM protein [Magnetococcales bacterium]|nr:B12-binding domain-containing radical SAM protein [Magnetococcales bacterium]